MARSRVLWLSSLLDCDIGELRLPSPFLLRSFSSFDRRRCRPCVYAFRTLRIHIHCWALILFIHQKCKSRKIKSLYKKWTAIGGLFLYCPFFTDLFIKYNPPLVHTVNFQTVLITLWANKICKKFDSINSDLLGYWGLKVFQNKLCFLT